MNKRTLKHYVENVGFKYIGVIVPNPNSDHQSGIETHLLQSGKEHKNKFAKSNPAGVYILSDRLYLPNAIDAYDGTECKKFGENEGVNGRFYNVKCGHQDTNVRTQEWVKKNGKPLYIYFLEAEPSMVKIPGPTGKMISVVQLSFSYRWLEKYFIGDFRQCNGFRPELNPNDQ